MTVKLDFEECLKDSPRFRAEIEVVQNDVSELETRLDKLVKQCHAMLEAGKVYCQTSKSFINGLRELGSHCSRDSQMEECLDTFSRRLSDIVDAYGEVIDTTQKSVKSKLHTFVKEDVRHFKDVRKEFERSSECLEGALAKNAQAPRGKPHEVEEASNALLNARRMFRSEALDYVLEINVIEAKRKTEILMAILSLIDAQAQFFQYGHQSLSELDDYRQKLSDEYTQFVLNSAREKRDMEQRHAEIKKKDVSYDDSIMDFNADAANGIAMEGYLYKRASNAFKTWSRRWFSIQKNQLVYQKKFKEQPTVVVEDLRLCTVKHSAENERRFCFEVVSPSKSCLLQADSERQQQAWISAVQNSIASAFQERREDAHSPGKSRIITIIRNLSVCFILRLVCLFLKRGADYNAKDKNEKDPITIAVDNANADIVTLLRIAKMNKEMREMDEAFGHTGDDTYQDIFRDFSHMASNNPEKLKRRSADPRF
ncbi:arf-GAP with coiled-coil, ANK repeat and PH domain-containing protein 1 [Boleophthalmus pectinirostris]|uniref:arf-GAP with coiled-coil, ANK repeat and PH domain-containing protein 1 n=1 Tax=Boleophthalmus pectinirostris TaxID=150288 RepID=UPI00243098B6|nr:arf-GAP with coiled-coil, ANK repeat and PH domain-containing protein 1 [Boleophthalmus pectinirostris]